MAVSGKSVKLFNLEERKNTTGAITEVDIYQWKNTLLDNLKREPDFADHCKDTSKWEHEKVENRGFEDTSGGDGTGKMKADQVNSMLTKIASYAPKSIVREITRQTRCLADIWNIARDWAGIQSSGSKHLRGEDQIKGNVVDAISFKTPYDEGEVLKTATWMMKTERGLEG